MACEKKELITPYWPLLQMEIVGRFSNHRETDAKIYAHAYYRLGNTSDAEDVTQEAFLKLWKVALQLEAR